VGERGVSSKSCGRFAAVFATPLGNLVVVIVAAALIFWGVWRAQRAGTQPRGSSQGVEAVSEQSEAKQELQGLRDRNEQLEQLNANLQAERGQLSELLQDTKCENRKLKEEHQAGQKEIQRLQGLYREALEDEHGVAHWGRLMLWILGLLPQMPKPSERTKS
jgi:chromosome segregation ATPase